MNHIAVVGLSVMGANLARNAARNGATVSLFNRTTDKMEQLLKEYGSEGHFIGCKTYEELAASFAGTKAILLMVKAGSAVDDVINELLPHLSKGDILIDGGNSHYKDSARRQKELAAKGFRFVGMGVSGGEEGALNGPSMMPGGDKSAVDELMPLFKKMAASDGDGGTCIAYMGDGGAGHFVKMVHNGIEYGMMQLIAEVYHIVRHTCSLKGEEFARFFGEWNKDPVLQSFLIEITSHIFTKKDAETGEYLVDLILDKAGQKGTGKWTTEAAFEYGVAVPTITAGVDARIISGAKEFRQQRSKEVEFNTARKSVAISREEILEFVKNAYLGSVVNTYGQGFQLLCAAEEMKFGIPVVGRIWRGGCIIRSGLLPLYKKVFAGDADASSKLRLLCEGEAQREWRSIVMLGASCGVPLPAMSASLSYFDAYRTYKLPQNLIQAQRDLFGAHTFQRIDKEGAFHEDWN